MKNKTIIITSISVAVLIFISIASYKLLSSPNKEISDPSEIIVSNYKGGTVTLKEAQIELNKIAR
jgi:hypothetical protein